MTETTRQTECNPAVAIATLCSTYGLNAIEFSKMLEALGHITPEQKSETLITCTAFAVKDMMDNQMKGVNT